ncbi:unnamed protein product [Parajaminaea phylloscopi]
MDRIKEKLNSLRQEADAALERAEDAEAKNKRLEHELLQKEQEIASLSHKNDLLEQNLDKADAKLTEHKSAAEAHAGSQDTADTLQRKIALLEEELDNAEKNLRETTEKLRQVDVKAEHFERQVARVEQERDNWEKKYEDAEQKYIASKKELDEVVLQMESL